MSFLDDATNVYDVESSTCGSSTDIWFYTTTLPTYTLGATSCQSWAFWSVCDRFNVYLENGQFISVGGACGSSSNEIDFNYVHTVRHEIGHTVGLQHDQPLGSLCNSIRGTDAMTSDWVDTDFQWVTYSPHHIAHVNCVCDF